MAGLTTSQNATAPKQSLMQLEIMRLINAHDQGRQLIICPLGVRQEFKRDAAMLGMDLTFVRKSHEVGEDGVYLTNYESVRDGKLNVNLFNAVSLDEASVLRSYGSKTYQTFLGLTTSQNATAPKLATLSEQAAIV